MCLYGAVGETKSKWVNIARNFRNQMNCVIVEMPINLRMLYEKMIVFDNLHLFPRYNRQDSDRKQVFFASFSLSRRKSHFAHLMFSTLIFVCGLCSSIAMHTRSWQFLAHSVYPKNNNCECQNFRTLLHISVQYVISFSSLDHNKLPMASFFSSLGYHFRREVVWVERVRETKGEREGWWDVLNK